jgi:hypothetical protein
MPVTADIDKILSGGVNLVLMTEQAGITLQS